MAAANQTGGDEESARIAALEAELERKEEQLVTVIERYERVIDTRARLRRETRSDESFVWTGEGAREGGDLPENETHRTADRLREFLQR